MIYAVTSSNVNDKLLASFHEINIAALLLPLANVMFLGYVAILIAFIFGTYFSLMI